MDVIEEIKRLQEIERRYNNMQAKLVEIGQFVSDWDSEDPDRLPLCRKAQINPVRNFYTYCS